MTDQLETVEQALAREAKAREWQSIETAPRDGSVVLGFYPPAAPHSYRVHTIKWKNGWCIAGGSKRTLPTAPSHWQSLPSPPYPITAQQT